MTNKVLVVDDMYSNIILLSEILKIIGYESDSRVNGQEAIDALKQIDYRIVFMDIEMPVKNGFEAAHEIRATLPDPLRNTPIIAISAHPQFFFEEKIMKFGFDDYISKPYTLGKVKAVLEKLNLMP